ncbi:hypothetical protein BO71DRAFT_204795 [Aspergillus ellipticus CBS 707.79]|uniref:Uncharacterized protein n=1 Tax=Aspergillus ellipticus CBS 707.79 TaxID=1448320 RepID=A0A319DMH7_9EURO|nr:hypothetical protein BO71DRAFT_204795 [Aspergillus ellipticus CBS 707.79]
MTSCDYTPHRHPLALLSTVSLPLVGVYSSFSGFSLFFSSSLFLRIYSLFSSLLVRLCYFGH